MDEVDQLDETAEMRLKAAIEKTKVAAAKIPAGNPGVCRICEEESLRLVGGVCALCRDGR